MTDQPTTTPPSPTPTTTPGQETIPYERFQQVVAEKNRLAGEIQSLSEKAATASILATQVKDWEDKYKALEVRTAQDSVLAGAGITDEEGRKVARFLYQDLPEANRPSMDSWIKSWNGQPPRALSPFINVSTPPTAPPTTPPTTTSTQRPGIQHPTPGTAQTATTTGNQSTRPTAEQLQAARAEAHRTGDWSNWKKLRGQL